jgi:hypothetical protein
MGFCFHSLLNGGGPQIGGLENEQGYERFEADFFGLLEWGITK